MRTTPLDVWLKFDSDEDEEPTYEANTFKDPNGGYCVEWYHNDVGQVTEVFFDTYREATRWLESEGFSDFTS